MIQLYLYCYNEELIIESTILHYKKMFPTINITILDNESTDKSAEIAENLSARRSATKGDTILLLKSYLILRHHNDYIKGSPIAQC